MPEPEPQPRPASPVQLFLAFNRMVPGRAECRIVRGGQRAEDRYRLGLGAEEIVARNRLLREGSQQRAEHGHEQRRPDSLIANVGDHQPQMAVGQPEDVV